jgi:hypothetical protein
VILICMSLDDWGRRRRSLKHQKYFVPLTSSPGAAYAPPPRARASKRANSCRNMKSVDRLAQPGSTKKIGRTGQVRPVSIDLITANSFIINNP